ncbi:MAG: hypothetical protein HKP55_09635 [Gammaproteobacteria bacterium]|nr:hypothetical protein [Gammaproteobacteria bacterium]NNJ91925.1 hypothetical protein [Gammaproteobacteria bacterium]
MMRTLLLLLVFLSLSACDNKFSLSDTATSINPPRPLMDMVLVDINGDAMPANLLRNHWTYVILADADCDETCMQYIEFTRAVVNEKQGELAMQRLLVLGYNPDKAFGEKLQADNPDMKIAILTRPIWAIFTVNFLQVATEVGGAPLYLVDPRAFLVTAYDDFVESRDLMNDLNVFNASLSD